MNKPEKKRVTPKSLPNQDAMRTLSEVKSSTAIRILIAEDHTVVRDGLVAIVKQERDLDVVADTGDGQQAVELWKKHRPDITLMDLRMPELDGVNAIYQIRAADPNARIIVLTTYDGDEDIYRGMRAGAKSYLLKDVRREELFQCIREVHAGRTFVAPAIAAKLAERLPAEMNCLRVNWKCCDCWRKANPISLSEWQCPSPKSPSRAMSSPFQKTQCLEPHRGHRRGESQGIASFVSI